MLIQIQQGYIMASVIDNTSINADMPTVPVYGAHTAKGCRWN